MIDALHISESGLKATQEWIDHISNNVANLQTAGYKKTQVQFQDMVNRGETSTDANGIRNLGARLESGSGARLSSANLDFSEGSLKATQGSLDFAISGKGFFEVILDNGETAYTRIGAFQLNNDGYLSTRDGHVLSDQIQIPPDASQVRVSEEGKVEALFSQSGDVLQLGQLHLAHIPNPGALNPLGGGLFSVNDDSGEAIIQEAGSEGMGTLSQGFIEMSNVELIDEMTSLVLAQRAYQLNARIIQTADQVLETINNLRR